VRAGPGLVARFQDPKNYYLGRVTRSGNRFSVNIYRIVKGVAQRLAHAHLPATAFTGTGTLEFDVSGSSLQILIGDGGNPPTHFAHAQDERISAPGSVGFRTSTDAQISDYQATA
jgi:hypothetical protein